MSSSLAVSRSGSIRKAADQLNVTASAVNRRIMDLEQELGAPLFERRPRGVRLTAAGEVFVHYLRQQDGEVERMKSQIEDLKGMRRGTVRIACSQALALEFLPRQIGEFRKRHPFVAFDVKVFDQSPTFFKTLAKVRAKYGLEKWSFEVTRSGLGLDTTYSILPDKQLTEEQIAKNAKLELHDLTAPETAKEGPI